MKDSNNHEPRKFEKVDSDNSLSLLSGDEDSTTRLNTWLNGGGQIPSAITAMNSVDASSTLFASLSPFSVPPPPRLPPTNEEESGIESGKEGDGKTLEAVRETTTPEMSGATKPILGTIEGDATSPGAISGEGRKREEAKPSEPKTRDVSEQRAVPKPQYNRTVSWGDAHVASGDAAAAKSPLSPKLSPVPSRSRALSDLSQLTSEFGQSPRTNYSKKSVQSSDRSVSMGAVLKANPLESEAETLILKAIDRQESVANRGGTNTGSSGIFSNIPDESASLFMSQAEGNNHHGDEKHETHSPVHYAQLSTFDNTASPTGEKSSFATHRAAAAPSSRPPLHLHKRNVTLEHTLASLAETLAAYHKSEAQDSNSESANPQAHLQGSDEPTKTAVSAGETLAKNANLIYRGRQKTAGKQGHVTGGVASEGGAADQNKATMSWSKLRTAVKLTYSVEKIDHSAAGMSQNDHGHPHLQVSGSVEKHKTTDDAKDEAHGMQDGLECGTLNVNESNQGGDDGVASWKKKGRRMLHRMTLLNMTGVHKGVVRDFQIFVDQHRAAFFIYIRVLFMFVVPAIFVASILFYFAGNPPTGRVDRGASGNGIWVNENGDIVDPTTASVSWWIIFVCVRQALTFSMAQLIQVFILDFLCLRTRCPHNIVGKLVTLHITQSKGWPFILCTWGVLDFALLYGSKFSSHWLYWQDVADIFNESNPAGSVTSNIWNIRVLAIAVGVGAVVPIKRTWLGFYLGKKTVTNYVDDLTKVAKKIAVFYELAALARRFTTESSRTHSVTQLGMSREKFYEFIRHHTQNDEGSATSRGGESIPIESSYQGGVIIDPTYNDPRRGTLEQWQKMRINELLGAWEDPEDETNTEEDVSIGGILQFRILLKYLENDFMFSIPWGDTSTRDRMVVSSQEVYKRLMLRSPDPNLLNFEVLAENTRLPDGNLDEEKLKQLLRLIRPDRDGNLSLLDFVKSVDVVYKKAKLLRASVRNSGKIDRAFEKAFNILFYAVVAIIILSQLGFDPFTIFLSISSITLAVAFMVGSASAKMFEGWLFILVRRPYNIGDRIHISNVETDTSTNGSFGWIVKDVTLFHTTAVFAATGERATMSNGSLAASRVINMARSPKAIPCIYLKFSTSVPYGKIQIFEQALREFVKARPREWADFQGFRATEVLADLGYIVYIVLLQHREAWQNINAILDSKAQVASFCLELSKKLEMKYTSPPLPVDLALVVNHANEVDTESVQAKFAMQATRASSIANEVGAKLDNKKKTV